MTRVSPLALPRPEQGVRGSEAASRKSGKGGSRQMELARRKRGRKRGKKR